MLPITKNITPLGEPQLLRTIADPTPKQVDGHLQDPKGLIICPHCHEETNLDARGLYKMIGNPHPLQAEYTFKRLPVECQVTLCHKCTGFYGIGKDGDKLIVVPHQVPQRTLNAEAIIARKKRKFKKLGMP